MDDFNINLTNCGSHTETQDYIDAMFQHSFIPLINKPTRITTTIYMPVVIDIICSNDILGTNYQSHGIIYTDISDHLPIFLLTKQINYTKIDTVMETRIYNEQTTFKESIDQITWDELYAFKNPKESYSKFHNEILNSFALIIARAALEISAKIILIARAALAIRTEQILIARAEMD